MKVKITRSEISKVADLLECTTFCMDTPRWEIISRFLTALRDGNLVAMEWLKRTKEILANQRKQF